MDGTWPELASRSCHKRRKNLITDLVRIRSVELPNWGPSDDMVGRYSQWRSCIRRFSYICSSFYPAEDFSLFLVRYFFH